MALAYIQAIPLLALPLPLTLTVPDPVMSELSAVFLLVAAALVPMVVSYCEALWSGLDCVQML